MNKVCFSNLELQTWNKVISSSVNSVLADAVEVAKLPTSVLKFTNASSAQYGGGLINYALPYPSLGSIALPFVGLDFQVYVSDMDLPLLGQLEFDLKIANPGAPNPTTNIANTFNFSAQLNVAQGNVLQISDPNGNWVNTGYVPLKLTPNSWIPVSMRYFMDIPNNKFSVLSALVGSGLFLIPPSLQQLAAQESNWSQAVVVQLQTEVVQPGGLNIAYKNINVTFADTSF